MKYTNNLLSLDFDHIIIMFKILSAYMIYFVLLYENNFPVTRSNYLGTRGT
jgi:hypothetical protein